LARSNLTDVGEGTAKTASQRANHTGEETMSQLELIVEEVVENTKPAAAEIIELTVDQMGEVGGGVAYVFL
jgi:hypothetical protein